MQFQAALRKFYKAGKRTRERWPDREQKEHFEMLLEFVA
jgi:hypothetical protein